MKYDAGAGAYDRLTGRWSRLYAPAVLNAAGVSVGSVVLDLATGTGDAALLASSHVQMGGTVVGVDISVPMLQVARSKSNASNVAFLAADAMTLPFRDGEFDAVICQFGLMFFPNKHAALGEMRRLLRHGGRIALTVWGPPEMAPFAGIMARALGDQVPVLRDEFLLPFALANPTELLLLLQSAGFRGSRVDRETRPVLFNSVRDFWAPYEQGGGRLGQAFLQLSPESKQAVRRDVTVELARFTKGEKLEMDVDAYLASGVV
jgi:SAM-dependent methyltransferase